MTNITLVEHLLAIAAANENNTVAKKSAVGSEIDYVANIQKKASNIVEWLDGNKPKAPEGCYQDNQGLYSVHISYKGEIVENQMVPFKLIAEKEVVRNYFTQLKTVIAERADIKKSIIEECKRLTDVYNKKKEAAA